MRMTDRDYIRVAVLCDFENRIDGTIRAHDDRIHVVPRAGGERAQTCELGIRCDVCEPVHGDVRIRYVQWGGKQHHRRRRVDERCRPL